MDPVLISLPIESSIDVCEINLSVGSLCTFTAAILKPVPGYFATSTSGICATSATSAASAKTSAACTAGAVSAAGAAGVVSPAVKDAFRVWPDLRGGPQPGS